MAMFQNIARLKTSKAIKILYQEFTRYLFLSTHKAPPPLPPHTQNNFDNGVSWPIRKCTLL